MAVTSFRISTDLMSSFLEDKERLSTSLPNGDRIADLLSKISRKDGARYFGDPLEWQRETRTEHSLHGRDEE